MSDEVNLNALMNQAVPTVMTYYTQVVDALDKEMGEGYAKKNPNLVASLVQSASHDMVGMTLSIQLEGLKAAMFNISASHQIASEVVYNISDSLEKLSSK